MKIIQDVAYDNYGDFQHVNFVFSQNFIWFHYFEDYLTTKLTSGYGSYLFSYRIGYRVETKYFYSVEVHAQLRNKGASSTWCTLARVNQPPWLHQLAILSIGMGYVFHLPLYLTLTNVLLQSIFFGCCLLTIVFSF
jgi:hypothetical protein